MYTVKLKIQDSVLDKIMYFLQNLPKNEVEVIEKKMVSSDEPDFITFLTSSPVTISGDFLTREDANAR